MERNGCWRLERTVVQECTGDDNPNAKRESESSQDEEGVCDGGVYGCHILTTTDHRRGVRYSRAMAVAISLGRRVKWWEVRLGL